MAKVLNAKHGVITEDRFQKMTDVQWVFHYLETVAEEKEQVTYEINLVKALIEVIKNSSELIAAYVNPKVYTKMKQEALKEKAAKSDRVDGAEPELTDKQKEIELGYKTFLSQFPEELVLENTSRNKLLRKITREEILRRSSLGINKKKE